MAFLSIVFGFILFGVCLLVFYSFQDRARRKLRDARSIDSSHPILIDVAAISRDLVPLIDKHALAGATINMVASDGAYFNSPNAGYFISSVLRWTKLGATLNYIVIEPSSTALKGMDELTYATSGKFIVHEVSHDSCDESVEVIISELMTLHPTLIELANGDKSMWVEYNHPVDSRFAYDVKFTSTKALIGDELTEFTRYKGLIDKLKEACVRRDSDIAPTQKTAA